MRIRKFLILLAAFLLLYSAAFSEGEAPQAGEPAAEAQQAEEQKEGLSADVFDIWDYGGEDLKFVTTAVPISDGVLMASAAVLPEDTGSLAVSEGVNIWEVKMILPDREGLTAMVFYDVRETAPHVTAWPILPWGTGVSATSCHVRFGDENISRINRAVLASEEITRDGNRCLLLTLSGPAPLGSAVVTDEENLAGIIVSQRAEGQNRYVAVPAEGIARNAALALGLIKNMPEWCDEPEGLVVALHQNEVVIDWSGMTLPEPGEGEDLYLVVVDGGNDYLTYYKVEDRTKTDVKMLLTPGRVYIAGFTVSAESPSEDPEQYVPFVIPYPEKLTDHGFTPVLTSIAEAPLTGLKGSEAPEPVTEVTEELLRSGRAYFYSHSTYEVTEDLEGSLLVTLTDPEGNNYRYTSSWIYSPQYMTEDIWFLPLKDMGLLSSLEASGFPKGWYTVDFYVDGKLADTCYFELK